MNFLHCKHEASRLTQKVISNGTISLRYQCSSCGQSHGAAVARSKVKDYKKLPFFDVEFEKQKSDEHKLFCEEQMTSVALEQRAKYEAYLKSDEWAIKRQTILNRDRYICHGCGGNANQVHHLTYRNLGDELNFQLVSICQACHYKVHNPTEF